MDKIIALLAAVEQMAAIVAALPYATDDAKKVAATIAHTAHEIEAELNDPANSKIIAWIKHHGNLPGTPESRAAAEAAAHNTTTP